MAPPGLSTAMLDAAAARAAAELDQGRIQSAADICLRLLKTDPGHAQANHVLGLAYRRAGHADEAIAAITKAIEREPDNAVYRSNLGVVLKDAGRLTDAVASYEAALRLDADLAQVRSNLGVALLARGRSADAVAAHRQAIALDPVYAEAHHNLGLALIVAGEPDAAIASFEQAVALKPDYAGAFAELADALASAGRLEAARAAAERATELEPQNPRAHHALGNILRTMEHYDAAAASYRRAIEIRPDAAAFRNLSRVLITLGDYREATRAARAAIELDPDEPLAHALLAEAHQNRGKHQAGLAAIRRAIELDPDEPRLNAMLAQSLVETGSHRDAIAILEKIFAREPNTLLGRQQYVFALNYLGDQSPSEIAAAARRYGQMLAEQTPRRTTHANVPEPERRLRVGLVSGDFREHVIARFLLSVLQHLDPRQVELFAYSTMPVEDAVTAQFKAMLPKWRNLWALKGAAAEAAIVADSIDILVDLSGLSSRNRLQVFARKPAPIAVTWLGYFATTGVEAIDYVFSTPWVIPASEEDQWVEKPWHLPETYLCFSRPEEPVAVAPPPALANGFVTFGSANNINKLNDATATCWAEVLAAVPQSRLLLRARAFTGPTVADETRERFSRLGIAPERLILDPGTMDYAQHLARYGDVDIALDPFPYNGGTTSIEALWMGVPVLARKGDRYVAHMGENILHNMGMPEWIAADTADYVRKATAFAADIPGLAALRSTLHPRLEASPLMDAPRFAGHLEAAFRGMWRKWCAEQARPTDGSHG